MPQRQRLNAQDSDMAISLLQTGMSQNATCRKASLIGFGEGFRKQD